MENKKETLGYWDVMRLLDKYLKDWNWGDCFPEDEEIEEFEENGETYLSSWTLIWNGDDEDEPIFCIESYSNDEDFLTDWNDKRIKINDATKEGIEKFIKENLRG